MKKICYYDLETEHFLADVNYHFDQLNMICGIIIDNDDNIFKFIGKDAIKDLYEKLKEYDVIVSFNGILFDNLVIAQTTSNFFDMNHWNEQPISFGKHKGTLWKDIPKDYLKWMLSQDVYPKMLSSIIYYLTCLKNNEVPDYSNSDQIILTELNNKSFDIFNEIKKFTGQEYPVSLNICTTITINKTKYNGISNKMIPVMFKEGKIDEIVDYCIEDVKILKELFEFSQQYGYLLIPMVKGTDKYQEFVLKVPINFIMNDEESIS